MRRFCRASGEEPSERRRSASRSHGAGRTDGASGARIFSAGSSGAVGLPDPPALESKTKQDGGGIQSRKQQRQSSKKKKVGTSSMFGQLLDTVLRQKDDFQCLTQPVSETDKKAQLSKYRLELQLGEPPRPVKSCENITNLSV